MRLAAFGRLFPRIPRVFIADDIVRASPEVVTCNTSFDSKLYSTGATLVSSANWQVNSSQEVLPIPGAAASRVRPPPQKDKPAKIPKEVYGCGLPRIPERGMSTY